MKLINFYKNNKEYFGVKTKDKVIHVEEALSVKPDEGIVSNVMDLIEGGEAALERLKSYINKIDLSKDDPFILDENNISWAPCVTAPQKIICVGLNYKKHADETNAPYPETPILFNKFNNTLTGHLNDIAVPKVTNKLDYEVELGIVIGKKAKDVSEEEAEEYIFGYCTANDLSARDLQFKTNQWLLGKSCDDFSPIGPYLVPKNEVDNVQNLNLKTTVNGKVWQSSNTSDMIFDCKEIVSYISQHMTLEPGDLILTGTPEGVVLGLPEADQEYLKPGDEVSVEIEHLGKLTNFFVKEEAGVH